MRIYYKEEIISIINLKQSLAELLERQSQAFRDFSCGRMQIPKPMLLFFPGGDCHVKAGFDGKSPYFIVKVATGFPANSALLLPSGDGTILVYSKENGLLQAILCDEGYLTTLRTALAAAIAARITPWPIHRIGIVGTGQLARESLVIMVSRNHKRQFFPLPHLHSRLIPSNGGKKLALSNVDLSFHASGARHQMVKCAPKGRLGRDWANFRQAAG